MKGLLINRIFLASTLILGTFCYYFLIQYQTSNKKYETITTFSSNATGMNVFYEIANRINPSKVEISKKAFFEDINVNKYSYVLILSPNQGISEREASIIKKYLNDGGNLILSILRKEELLLVEHLLKALELKIKTYPNENFTNQVPQEIKGSNLSSLISANESYSFYSGGSLIENNDSKAGIKDFYTVKPIGKGHLHLMLGIPPISNLLITQSHNRQIAYRIIDSPGTILIDEYRHFFTEKTLTDLFLDPSFSIPLLGMALLVFIYLLFSNPHDLDNSHEIIPKETDYHQLNSNLILGLWRSKGLLNEALVSQGHTLANKFPHRKNEFDEEILKLRKSDCTTSDTLISAEKIFRIHKEILNEKGIRG